MSKKTNPPHFLAISSSDNQFMHKLIDWLNEQTVKPDSTLIRVCDEDPVEKAELMEGQIEGMTIRIQDLERRRDNTVFYEKENVVGSILDSLIL